MSATKVRIFLWACECSVWADGGGEYCHHCERGDGDACGHYYSRETAVLFAAECCTVGTKCDACGEEPTVREFAEVNP